MQETLYPTSFLKGKGLGRACALATDGPLRRHLGPVRLPRCAGGRGGRDDRAGRGRRPGGDRRAARSLELAVPEADLAARRQRVLDTLGGYRSEEPPVSEALRPRRRPPARCGHGRSGLPLAPSAGPFLLAPFLLRPGEGPPLYVSSALVAAARGMG